MGGFENVEGLGECVLEIEVVLVEIDVDGVFIFFWESGGG